MNAIVKYLYDYYVDRETGWHDIGYSPSKEISFTEYPVVIMFSLSMLVLVNSTFDFQISFVGICSHESYNGRANCNDDIRKLNKFQGVFVLNRFLYNDFSNKLSNCYYCPNGVDTKLFYPKEPLGRNPKLTIGWVGNPAHSCNKGYYQIIEPLSRNSQYKFIFAKNRNLYKSHADMVDFYNSIDVYVCTSEREGTPNPCLEAASCGRPILTTPVGNMPEFIHDGINGYFIKRSIKSLEFKLAQINEERGLLRKMGKKARSEAIKWDWDIQAEKFLNMFMKY